MAMNLRWVGKEDFDRVAETRLRCYAPAAKELEKFKSDLLDDHRAAAGDFLLLEQDGRAIGTTTSLSLAMWVRGVRLSCQGVAYVGTIRTARRGGIANQLMNETIRKARERGQIISALMPFRATFYERFGYGFAEQRTEWTVPLSLMPPLDTTGLRYATASDAPAIAALRQRFVERGQCDVETSPAGWILRRAKEENGFQVVDMGGIGDGGGAANRGGDTANDGEAHGWASLISDFSAPAKPTLRVEHASWDSPAHLLRLISFLGQQRDQFSHGAITLPGDVPLNRILRETQLPHRPVAHAYADTRPFTRMQLRVLDHRRFLEAVRLPQRISGTFTVAVHECEGEISRWRADIDSGRVTAKAASGDCDFSCADKIWASIASGDLPARTAVELGLAKCADARVIGLLDAYAEGPAPYCGEFF